MRLDAVVPSLIKTAIGIYLEEAWGELSSTHWPRIDFENTGTDSVLEGFSRSRATGTMRSYSLRLGNRRYPFMKVVFQELLVRDVFSFTVDTHDELDIKDTTPDYSEWLAIRDYNGSLKRAVESRWSAAGVPTLLDVQSALESQEVPSGEVCTIDPAPSILIVDDDTHIAAGVQMIFDRRGYSVTVEHSAEAALNRLETLRPDLILSDLEMGSGLTGLQLCERVRQRQELREVPFILATAAGIDLAANQEIDGFLVKPYELNALIRLVSARLHSE